jgi:FtsH-binding integral membrane protein
MTAMVDYTKMNLGTAADVGFDVGLRSYMVRIYKYMCVALILTGAIAYAAGTSPEFIQMMFTQVDGVLKPSGLFYVVAFAPLAPWLVYFFSHGRLSYPATHAVFWSYAALMGLSLFSIFIVYTGESITRVFFITSAVFGGMSLFGYTTKKDLTGVGSFLIMGMWGLFIAFIVNMFLKSAAFDYALSIIAVIIFTGLVAYMNQQLKQIYFQVAGNADAEGKAAVFGAMTLYITFINLFISLLRLFGDRR